MSQAMTRFPKPRPSIPLSWKSVAWVSFAGLAILLSSLQGTTLPSAILFLVASLGYGFTEWIERNRWERMDALEIRLDEQDQRIKDLTERHAVGALMGR